MGERRSQDSNKKKEKFKIQKFESKMERYRSVQKMQKICKQVKSEVKKARLAYEKDLVEKENGIPVDVVLLDFSKAFDTVPHRRLIAKLKAYGFDGLVIKWIEAFLKDRKQRVVQDEIVSEWVSILSSVIQGSVIGPLLFVLFINDLRSKIANASKIYVDDTKILSVKVSEENVSNLQLDLNRAFKWTEEWLLKFNTKKCVLMHYGRHIKRVPLHINGEHLA